MFYSQTFLARKGPLGTVWCAAHLQHKLRKSHYTSTDIPSTVDRILYPDVPIALRMSGHLLLGVVRIYSKKVDYLYHDCNLVSVTLKNAFVSTDVNLPPNATQAQFNAVTLPETYQLDSLDFDDVWSSDKFQDSHVLSQEDITLTDEIDNPPLGGYVAITFDDDIPHSEPPHEGLAPMEEGNDVPINSGEGEQEPIFTNISPDPQAADDDATGPNTDNMDEQDNTTNVDVASHDIEEIEVMRDTVIEPNPVLVPEIFDCQTTSIASPVEHSGQIIRDRETPTLSEENVHVEEQSPLLRSLPSTSRATPEPFQLNPSPGNNSPALELQPSVQPQPQRPKARKRKQKQLYDQVVGFSNRHMKERLQNHDDIVKKRRKVPCSSFDAWRFNNRKMKEQLFFEPLITGLCSDLKIMSEQGFTSSSPNLVLSEETHPVPTTTQLEEPHQDTMTEQPSNSVEHLRDESPEHPMNEEVPDPIEHLRDEASHHEPIILADLIPSSPRIASPTSHHNIIPPLSPDTAFQSMQDLGNMTGTGGSKQATPMRDSEVGDYSGNAGRSYSPQFMTSAADDELAFLELDSQSPADSQGTQGSGTLSARTRAVAQYLMGQSPLSSSPTERHEDRVLSLKTILHGRSRKMCARMIYETLVLSSYGLISVEQEEPTEEDEVYGDIKMKLTAKVCKGQF